MQIDKLIRSNRKSITLQIDENAQLIVRAPHFVSIRKINQFINEKSDWIQKTLHKAKQRNQIIQQNNEFKDGKIIWYLGRKHELRINVTINKIELKENYFEFPYKKIDTAEDYLIKWYKVQAQRIISVRCTKYAEKINLVANKISITSAQKRWGSCNTKGNINFSYRLIMTPIDVIDYVIMHELMHLKEMNHSNKFWANVEEFIPDYKQKRKWLKDNQHRFIL